MGLTLAYFLSEKGQQVTVLEQSATLGGLHDSVQFQANLSVPRYQHNIFPTDTHTFGLIRQLGLQDEIQTRYAHSGFVHNGEIHPLRTIWDFMSFRPLRLQDRLRLGQTIIRARMTRDWRALDQIAVKDWLIEVGGQRNFERIWAPLLEAKFDQDYSNVPATFIWSWLNRASGLRSGPEFKGTVAYLRQGPQVMIQALSDAIVARGGDILTQTRVREIELEAGQLGKIRTHTGILDFDIAIATLPTPDLSRLLLSADESYLRALSEARYLGLVCPVLVLDKPLSDYWTLNLTDPSSPFSTIIEMPCPGAPNYHLVYLPKYTAAENDWQGVPDEAIRDAWLMRLRQIYPSLKTEHILHFAISKSRYVDPLHGLDAAARIPAFQTPYRGLYLANTSQVYPELPTSEAVIAYASRIARQLIEQGEPRLIAQPAA
jgi:protoporphyrinogen oxidase